MRRGIEGWTGVCQVEEDEILQAVEIAYTKYRAESNNNDKNNMLNM